MDGRSSGNPEDMNGALLGTIIAFVVLLVAGVFMSPWFIAPAVLLVLFALFAGPLGAMIRAGDSSPGTPSTTDAAYDPVSKPTERTA